MLHPLHRSPSRAAALLIALASVATLAPAQAGPAQRFARHNNMTVREARQILRSNGKPYGVGPADPDTNGGSVDTNYSGPAIGPASPNAIGGSTVAPGYSGPFIGPAW